MDKGERCRNRSSWLSVGIEKVEIGERWGRIAAMVWHFCPEYQVFRISAYALDHLFKASKNYLYKTYSKPMYNDNYSRTRERSLW